MTQKNEKEVFDFEYRKKGNHLFSKYIENVIRSESIDFQKIIQQMHGHILPHVEPIPKNFSSVRILHAVMGISTEAGELLDAIKKYLFYIKTDEKGRPDLVNIIEELGDLFWYIGVLADAVSDLDDQLLTGGEVIMHALERNVQKLRSRYPKKFDEVLAENRDLKLERTVLEQFEGKEETDDQDQK